MVDALVSKTNPKKGVGSNPTLGIGCSVMVTQSIWVRLMQVQILPPWKWDVAKSGKALDFGSNIHGFKSHRPNESRVSLMVKYPAFNRWVTGSNPVRGIVKENNIA